MAQVYLVDLAFAVIRHEVSAAEWEEHTDDTDAQLSHVMNSLQAAQKAAEVLVEDKVAV